MERATFAPTVLRSPLISVMMHFNHWFAWVGLMLGAMLVTYSLGVPSRTVEWGVALMASWVFLLPWYLRANLTLADQQVLIRNPGHRSKVLHASEISRVEPDTMQFSWMNYVLLAVVVFTTHSGESHRATLSGATKKAKGHHNYVALRDWCGHHSIRFDVPGDHLETHPAIPR